MREQPHDLQFSVLRARARAAPRRAACACVLSAAVAMLAPLAPLPVTPPEMATSIGGGGDGEKKGGIDKDTIIQAHGQSYKALQVVGTGSFGVVIQAQVVETGELVAIKKVLQDKRFKVRACVRTAAAAAAGRRASARRRNGARARAECKRQRQSRR